MFTHEQVWHGIDRLARERGLTASGLARRAGLDPTTFNPSKRVTKQRKPRWPSTESGQDPERDRNLARRFRRSHGRSPARLRAGPSHRLRCIAMDQAVRPELFDEAGFPVGAGWDEIDFPNLEDPHAYALEVRGDDFLPTYRDGDLVVVSPTAGVRRRDRIMLQTKAGAIMAGTLLRRTAQRIEIDPWLRIGVAGAAGPRSGVAGASRLGLAVRSMAIGVPLRRPGHASKERAAGKPAAEGTGRHHNVREDIGLIGADLKAPPPRSSRCLSNTANLNEFLTRFVLRVHQEA